MLPQDPFAAKLTADRFTNSEISFSTNGYHEIQVEYWENGGAASVSLDWTKLAGCMPAAPALISPADGARLTWDADINLVWNAAAGAAGYYARLWGGPGVDISSNWQPGTSWPIGGLLPGVYQWSVKARNDYGDSDPSQLQTRSFTVLEGPPVAPYDLQATTASRTQINLAWQDAAYNATGFKIYRGGAYLTQVGASQLTHQDTGLSCGAQYCYAVSAFNANGESAQGDQVCATTAACAAAPSAEFDAWPQSGDAPLTVSMHIVSTENISSCVWDYGDQQTGTTCSAYHDHEYTNPGSYTVQLTVSGPGGNDTKTRSNYINVTTQQPTCPIDDFDSARVIDAIPFQNTQDISNATSAHDDPAFPCKSAAHFKTVWYRFVPSTPGRMKIDTYGSNYDTVLGVWTGARGALQPVPGGCNDDATDRQSEVTVDVSADVAYYIEVASYYEDADGILQLNMSPVAMRPVTVDDVEVLDESYNPVTIVNAGATVRFRTVATNHTGQAQDSVWTWAIYGPDRLEIPELGYHNYAFRMETGENDLVLSRTFPATLPGGRYQFVGAVKIDSTEEWQWKSTYFTVVGGSTPTSTWTNTPIPPTPTWTNTPIPPTATWTHTPVPPTPTSTRSIDTARIRFAPATKRANLSGGAFTVDLTVENVANLAGFQTDLLFDPAVVHVNGVSLGAFLGSTGRTATLVGPTIDNTGGKVTFGAFSFGAQGGAAGAGTLATISFQPRVIGTTALRLQATGLSDPAGNALPVTTADGQAQIVQCFGDFNGDNKVDIFDLQRAAGHWNCRAGQACYDAQFDTEPDGDIDVFDLQRFAAAWGTVCPATAARLAPAGLAPTVGLASVAAADLSVLPPSRQVAPAAVFIQTVQIQAAGEVGAFQATLAYSPTVAQVEAVTVGPFLGATGRTVVPVGPAIDNVTGEVRFGAFTFGSQAGASGAGDLAQVRFRAQQAGRTALSWREAGVSDLAGNALPSGALTGAEIVVDTPKTYLPLLLRP